MKRFSQQFNTAAKRVTMTKAESRDLKERLTAYMEYHPLPESARSTTTTKKDTIASQPFYALRINTLQIRAFASMTALLALIIVPVAAERAVPGDTLYPVKVRFNEEVRSTLAITPYQQVEWETKRVERRLAEARLLATEGKLTDELEAEVVEAVKSHTDAAQAGLAELRATDSDEATIAELTFASALEVESEVLATETARQQAAGASTTVAIAAVIADARATVATPDTINVSLERLLAQVEIETTRATELLASLNDDLTDAERADIDRRLSDIDRKVQQALESTQVETVETVPVETETTSTTTESATTTAESEAAAVPEVVTELAPAVDEATAKQYLLDALRDTQKLIRFMTDIDVKTSVSVEELVPVYLTDEERVAAIEATVQEVNQKQEALSTRVITDEKMLFALNEAEELLTTTETAVTNNDIGAAEAASREALALLVDVEAALVDLPVVEEVAEPVVESEESETATTTPEIIEENNENSATTTDESVSEPATDTENDEQADDPSEVGETSE